MVDPSLFSGLISAIGYIGKQLFNENIADISFGMNRNSSKIGIISKELISADKKIFFVFLYSGDLNLKNLRELSTNIYIETKSMLVNRLNDVNKFRFKVDNLLDTRYHGLKNW